MNFFKTLAVAGASMAVAIGSAAAATLSVEDPGGNSTPTALPGTFDPSGEGGAGYGGVTDTTVVTAFGPGAASYADTGLFVNGLARVTFTFLGTEAGFTNELFQLIVGSSKLFDNQGDTSGSGSTFDFGPGFIPFRLDTDGGGGSPGSVTNGGPLDLDTGLNIAFYLLPGAQSAIVMFGDGLGDTDYDDLVFRIDVAEVPIPGAALLFGTALLGGGLLRRKKRKAATA